MKLEFVSDDIAQLLTFMALSRAHISVKVADIEKLLLLDKQTPGNTYRPMRSMAMLPPNPNPNPNPNTNPTVALTLM